MGHLRAVLGVGAVVVIGGLLPIPICAQDQWLVQVSAAVSIGDGSGEGQDLFSVRDATVARDGRILILDGGSHSIRVYSPEGKFIRAVGRDGNGPGEYKGLRTFCLLESGELLVHDAVAQRLTRLDENLEVVETRRVAYDVGASTPVRGQLRPLESGTVLVARGDIGVMEAVRRPEGLHGDDLVVVALRGEESRTILRRPKGPTFTVRTGQQGLSPPVPFEEAVLFAAGRSGLVVGTTHGTSFRRITEAGEVAEEFVAEGSPRAVTSADWDLFEDDFRRRRSGGIAIRGMRTNPEPNVDKFLNDTPRGRQFPLFDALLVDEQDRLWVRAYSLEGDTVNWQVVEAERGVVGLVTIPRDWTLLEAGSGYILVLERDELDVEMVRKYTLGN